MYSWREAVWPRIVSRSVLLFSVAWVVGGCVTEPTASTKEPQAVGAGGCGADLSSDPRNCGACGHDCLGATCTDGYCEPEVIAPDQESPQYIAVNADTVYWSTMSGEIRFCPKQDCSGSGAVFASSPHPQGLAATDSTLYWADFDSGKILSCAADGCTGQPLELASGQEGAVGLTVDGESVYWATKSGSVATCPRSGCVGQPTVLLSGLVEPLNLAVGNGNVYVTDRAGGKVVSCATTGCDDQPTVIADEQAGPLGIAVNARSVYWTNQQGNALVSCPVSGCVGDPDVLVADQLAASGLVVDSNFAYFTDFGPYVGAYGDVARYPLEGGDWLRLARGQGHPLGIAIDGEYAYWVNTGLPEQDGSGSVMRVAK